MAALLNTLDFELFDRFQAQHAAFGKSQAHGSVLMHSAGQVHIQATQKKKIFKLCQLIDKATL